MEGFDKSAAFDELTKLLNGINLNTPSGVVYGVKTGQEFLQGIYERGFMDGLEISKKNITVHDDRTDPTP